MTEGQKMSGKFALVTGAARGIGEASARRLHAEGATVILSDLNPDGKAVAAELGERASFLLLDATVEEDWLAATEQLRQQHGHLDVLVNNAGGAAGVGPFETFDLATHRRMLDLNLTSTWLGSRCAVALMRPDTGGSIVNISSIDGLVGVSGMASYTAAKFGVTGLTRTLALELGDRRIRINSVHPGFIGSPLVLGAPPATQRRLAASIAQQPIKRLGRPEEIAAAVLFFASDESSFCTGSQLVVDGGHLAGPWRSDD